jgi:hypothetical protein
MRSQRPADKVPAIDAVAEQLPLDADSVDAAMAMITIHQWTDGEAGLRELRRVARDRVVVLAFDGDAVDRFWLAEYAPELMEVERRRDPKIDWVCEVLGGAVVTEVPIPIDCADGFTEAFYARPESFLDPRVRAAQSAWGFITPEASQRTVETLRQDLASGRWDQMYAAWRTQPHFTGSLRLLVGHP